MLNVPMAEVGGQLLVGWGLRARPGLGCNEPSRPRRCAVSDVLVTVEAPGQVHRNSLGDLSHGAAHAVDVVVENEAGLEGWLQFKVQMDIQRPHNGDLVPAHGHVHPIVAHPRF